MESHLISHSSRHGESHPLHEAVKIPADAALWHHVEEAKEESNPQKVLLKSLEIQHILCVHPVHLPMSALLRR
jgi:hypothetical protein